MLTLNLTPRRSRPSSPWVPNRTHMDTGGLYLLWLSDSHYYGGRARCFNERWQGHLKALRQGRHCNLWMQRLYNIHGMFEPEVCLELPTGGDHQAAEQAWIDENYGKPGCVNLSRAADGGAMTGRRHTTEARAKMSASRKGKPTKAPSLETRAKMSESGRKRAKIFGVSRPHTEDTKAKMSSSHKGLVFTEEHKLNMSLNHASKRDPEGYREKLRAAWSRKKGVAP